MMTDTEDTIVMALEELKEMTPAQLAGLGTGHIGYITWADTDEGERYILYAADGTELATAETEAAAEFAAEHLEIEPVTVH